MSMNWLNEVPSNADAQYTSERIVHSIREYAVQGIFFLLLLNWHEILFPKHLYWIFGGLTLLANQRYVIMHNVQLYTYSLQSKNLIQGSDIDITTVQWVFSMHGKCILYGVVRKS